MLIRIIFQENWNSKKTRNTNFFKKINLKLKNEKKNIFRRASIDLYKNC